MSAPFVYKVGELVQVESVDEGFEGCWCEAIIQRMVSIAPAAAAKEPRVMYEAKYTRFVSGTGKPILETVCEARIRRVPPELEGFVAKEGDFVDAFWRDGWWEGIVVERAIATGGGGKCSVRFPRNNQQKMWLDQDDLRPQLKYDGILSAWCRKMPKNTSPAVGGAASAHSEGAVSSDKFEWVTLDPVAAKLKPATRSEPRKKRPTSSAEAPATKQHRVRPPFPDVPLAPSYYPTAEEFAEPFRYINSIKAEAEKYGICKIVPPPNWKPSWSIDSHRFLFDTRIQNIHQLQERGEFLFWRGLKRSLEQRGTPLKVLPRLAGKQLNLFALYRWVVREGGHKKMNAQTWTQAADALKVLESLPDRGVQLRAMYDSYLAGFEEEESLKHAPAEVDTKAADSASNVAGCGNSGSSKEESKKAAGAAVAEGVEKVDQRCEICLQGADPEHMLLCDACDGGYHTYCLRPKVTMLPRGNWYCSRCKMEGTEDVMKDEPFGFEDGPQYTLTSFHTLADSYKQRWFSGLSSPDPDKDSIERDFWDIVEEGSLRHDVQVVYGADLPTLTHGSGFATDPEDPYSKQPWNLNVMPTLAGSLLRHLSRKVSGLVAPWLYIGMLFSSFCWHNEDNYLYSINYMHWGATKTWYGVPGRSAEEFEAVMRASMPELFSYSPDLLYHITTMLSPRNLIAKGVPCYKINQECGEYVVTFPQAYHAGFSHGFNCCEAVNFATADWVAYGLAATARYRQFKHIAAFSVAKLLCTIAEAPLEEKIEDGAEALQLLATHIGQVVEEEKRLRDQVTRAGLVMKLRAEHAPDASTEDGDEDGRLCSLCKQNCYLSFVTCPCTSDRSCCLLHCHKMCSCEMSRRILFFRYSDEELDGLKSSSKVPVEATVEDS